MDEHIFLSIEDSQFTLSQLMTLMRMLNRMYPNMEIFLDGETYSIMGRVRDEAHR